MNKLQDDAQILAECREACDRLIARGNAVDDNCEIGITTLEKVRETTALLESELDGTTSGDRAVGRRLKFAKTLVAVRRFGWLLLYTVTILGIIWWYKIRPSWEAHRQLQGTWQFTEGFVHEERLKETYFQVVGSETWLTYPLRSKWTGSRSRISVQPADDFFIVRREIGSDYGRNIRETEYIVRLANDRLYLVRGMATLDAMKERKIEKLRRIKQLPPQALQWIETSQ